MNTDELFSILRSHRERHPADGEAFDRVGALLGLPPLYSNGSAALDKALNLTASTPPPLSLPLRIKAAKASTLGWSADLYALTILVSNVSLRQEDGALLPRAGEPIVAVCAEYDRPLASLDPPELGRHSLASARTEGVPTLRLPAGGFFRLLARRLLNGLQFFPPVLLLPAALFLVPPALVLPLFDFLDRDRNFTLGYICTATRFGVQPLGCFQNSLSVQAKT